MVTRNLQPSYVDPQGREYYNRTLAAYYLDLTDSGFRKQIKKLEKEQGIIIPMARRSGTAKLIDRRILDQFLKPVYENKWYDELRQIIETINSEP